MRNSLKWFVRIMDRVLKDNSHKHGWRQCSKEYLTRKLHEEARELGEALACAAEDEAAGRDGMREVNREVIRLEAADVANIALMIADNWGGGPRRKGARQ